MFQFYFELAAKQKSRKKLAVVNSKCHLHRKVIAQERFLFNVAKLPVNTASTIDKKSANKTLSKLPP